MATKSTSRSTAKRGGSSRKRTAAQQRARRQMQAVVLFAVGVFLSALALIKGASFWLWLHNALYGLFGTGAVAVPVLLIYLAVLLTRDKPVKGCAWESGFLLAFFCAALQIFSMGLPMQEHLLDQLIECIVLGMEMKSGGLIGAAIGLPMLHLFGKIGAGITIVLLIFVFLMLVTGSTLIGLARGAAKPVRKIEETYVNQMELQEQRRAQRAAQQEAARRQRIDIPLDGEPPRQPPEQEQAAQEKQADQPQAAQQQEAAHHPKFNIDISLDDDFVPKKAGGFSLGVSEDELEVKPEPATAQPEKGAKPVKEAGPSLEELVNRASSKVSVLTTEQDPLLQRSQPVPPVQSAAASELHIPGMNLPPILPDPADLEDESFTPILPEDEPFLSGQSHRMGVYDEGEQTVVRQTYGETELVLDEQTGEVLSGLDELSEQPLQQEDAAAEPQQEPLSAAERGTPDLAIQAELQQIVEAPPKPVYHKPPIELLREPVYKDEKDISEEMKANAQRLVDTLASFGVQTRIVDISRGPAVTRYELQPSAGVKISKITGLADDIALNLAAAGVRIEAPIPNKAAVGIEVPNKVVSAVAFREIVDSPEFEDAKSRLTAALGRDLAGKVTVFDIDTMPHLLIAGSTGSGKSVCINSIIMSLLYKSTPEEVRFLMIDPKVVELGVYNGIPQLLVPVVTDPKKAAGALSWAVSEMLKRYKLLADNSVRDLASYNSLAERTEGMEKLPQIVIIVDELADLMMAAPNEIEDSICRLAQMARAAGMHLIIATQRPSVDVITGIIKANIPSRIAFAVSSQIDSRTILDMGGAEKLLGRGDMLFNPRGAVKPIRVQGCFVTDEEIERVISFIKNDAVADYDDQIVKEIDNHVPVGGKGGKGGKESGGEADGAGTEDEMLIPAIECVVEAGMASTSLLQRRLKLGYARAARIVDEMEQRGIVGPFEGSKPRQVLITMDRWVEMKMNQKE